MREEIKTDGIKRSWLSQVFRRKPKEFSTPNLPQPSIIPPVRPPIKRIKLWQVWKLGSRIDQKDLDSVVGILPLREEALEEAINGLKRLKSIAQEVNLTDEQIFALASTDVFVEKAQRVLTRRSRSLYISGIISTSMTFFILGLSIYFIYLQVSAGIPETVIVSTQALIFRIFQSIALSAFVLVALKWLLTLSRSFFHEALSLLERRHALRYGRLFVYLKKGVVDDKMLIEAFQWNKETRTSFLDMRPEVISETLFHKVIDVIGKLPPETVKAIAETRKATKV